MADAYLLDSCTIIAALRGEPAALLNRLVTIAPNRLHLSSIVLAELATGAEKSPDRARKRKALAELTDGMVPLPFAAMDAHVYGRIALRWGAKKLLWKVRTSSCSSFRRKPESSFFNTLQ